MTEETKKKGFPDFDAMDDIPTTRRERQKAIWEIIERGEERHEGYNLQQLMGKLSVRWGMKFKTIQSYFEDLQKGGLIYVDGSLRVRIKK